MEFLKLVKREFKENWKLLSFKLYVVLAIITCAYLIYYGIIKLVV